MWSCYSSIAWIFVSLIQLEIFQRTLCLSPLWDSVTTNVNVEYDVQEGNQVWVVRMDMGEYKSTDLVIGEDIRPDSRIILKCIAHHGPAEWVYSGDGEPEFTTNTTVENLSSNGEILPMDDMNGAKRYMAILTLGKRRISTKDTGRYNCMTASPETGMKYKTLSAFYHIYVPVGDKLFIREKGETVTYDLTRSAARIPCGVTNPKTSVTLQKMYKGRLQFIQKDKLLYHPISGFYPKQDIPGTYICTAAFNNTFEMIHFTLVPSSSAEANYHQNLIPNKTKPSKPEDLEWFINSNPTKHQSLSSKRPTITTSKPKKQNNRPPYIPFHIRYSSTTYGPFQTFYDIKSATTNRPFHKQKTTNKHKPFNPFEYPSEIILEPSTKRPFASRPGPTKPVTTFEQKVYHQSIPSELISYRPVFNYFKDTSRPTSTLQSERPTIPLSTHDTITSTPSTRTTPRRYRPTTTIPTTFPTKEISTIIPDTLICSEYTCGTNAECFVHNVYYESLNESKREAGCKCTDKFPVGNPYLECYPPMVEMDLDTLYFNSSFRSPLIPVTPGNLYNQPDEDISSENNQNQATTGIPVDIIEM